MMVIIRSHFCLSGTRGKRTRGRAVAKRDNFQRPKKIALRRSESASTRTISAEGSLRLSRIRTGPQRERGTQKKKESRQFFFNIGHACSPEKS